jgi:light-regulated signal transduction histidine kinase (bacteriophytochrome)
MTKKGAERSADLTGSLALLASLSDDLALPLLQIKTSLELIDKSPSLSAKANQQRLKAMSLASDTGLQLVEAYRLALQADNVSLPLEPVAVGAVLSEVAHQLDDYANQYKTVIEVDVQPHLTPVLAHKPSLIAAMQCLGASLIRAQSGMSDRRKYRVMLGAHRTADNVIATGVFSNVSGLSDKALRSARALTGRARQPLGSLPAGSAGGVLIADILCAAMWQPLRAAAHRNMNGLATAVPVSKQLHLI